jgi:transcription elongation GreA/GreB family factor
MNQNTKQNILQFLTISLKEKQGVLQSDALDLQNSLENEAKSSAGDKHNTSRAMIHIEQEKLGEQIYLVQQQINRLQQISKSEPSEKIGFGSLVRTEKNYFLLGISLGKITFENKIVFCISMESPIGQLLLNKCKGDTIIFMQKEVDIEEVK